MFLQGLLEPLGREALARTTLLINHVLSAEPEATRRLQGQTGRSIALAWRSWPGFLPAPPRPHWDISPAGLMDLIELPAEASGLPTDSGATLTVTLDAADIARWLAAGAVGRPPMDIRGDAALAAEVSWLAENLRWDIEDDLARVIGDAPARQLAQFGRTLTEALRRFLHRMRPGTSV
jgi:ubiquinone biosynthesis accessory factor UbiJ